MYKRLEHKDKRFTGAVTGQAVWTPATGKAIAITDLVVTTSAAASISIFVNTDAEGNRLVDGDFAANSGVALNFKHPLQLAADDEILITTSAGNSKVVLYGFER